MHDAGVWRLPDGPAYYRASLVNWATTDKTAEQIHQLGLDIVADLPRQIDAIMKKSAGPDQRAWWASGCGRCMRRSRAICILNTDAAKEQMITDLNVKVKQMQARLPEYFGTLPKAASLKIRRVPKNIEAGAPGGYYNNASLDGKRPGIYWINLRDTAEVPKWTLGTLTYHEGIPGHHLQLSMQQEAGLPLIRKTSFYSAYIEGWALYAEQLAAEMGLYDQDDPVWRASASCTILHAFRSTSAWWWTAACMR